jgi:hypothetical protein
VGEAFALTVDPSRGQRIMLRAARFGVDARAVRRGALTAPRTCTGRDPR